MILVVDLVKVYIDKKNKELFVGLCFEFFMDMIYYFNVWLDMMKINLI